jgi:hypothetical protein
MVESSRNGASISRVDTKNQTFRDVSLYAERIATLLKSPVVAKNSDLEACLDDLLGALYALVFAKQAGFVHRVDRPIEISAVITHAEQVSKGEVRVDGKWIAGFQFNSALYRISATYHRTLKLVIGKDGDIGTLLMLKSSTDGQVTDLKGLLGNREFRARSTAPRAGLHRRGVFYQTILT